MGDLAARKAIKDEALKRMGSLQFGDYVTNVCAGEGNPTRHGYFVEHVRKSRKTVGGLPYTEHWAKCTDRKGKFWNIDIKVIYRGHLDMDECKTLFQHCLAWQAALQARSDAVSTDEMIRIVKNACCFVPADIEEQLMSVYKSLTALQAGAGDGEDTARIDYLETLRGDMITGTSDDQELIGHDWVIYGQFYTAREALDYGMMKRQEAIDNAQATEGK